MTTARYDVAVIGGGIIGLATAMRLLESHPRLRLVVLEKERAVAQHQTGHNSGVIHSGIYYRPGSHKAQLCVAGVRMLLEFCDKHSIHYELCGKVIVATSEEEMPRLEELLRRGLANGVPGLRMIEPAELHELEPHAAGIRALHSPRTGIVDYVQVCRAYVEEIQRRGGELRLGARVKGVARRADGLHLETVAGEVHAGLVVNCGGLHADRIARMTGAEPDVRIVPFRGEYYVIRPEKHQLVRNLIYPVPDPAFPFLGVHFTRTVHGVYEAGPNAVLAFAREGYRKSAIKPGELWGSLAYPGMWKVARKYWRTAGGEFKRSYSKKAFVKALQRLLPEVRAEDLAPGGAGVRAQAVARDGSLVDDFRITQTEGAVHVLNAPSPGATASLAIGGHIAGLVAERLGLGK